MTISKASGPGPIFGTLNRTVVGGVATFNDIVIQTAGSYTLQAVSGSLTAATSASFSVTAAAAASIAFTTQPTTATAGLSMPTFVVSARDAFGNVAVSYGGLVTISLASGPGAIFSGTTTVTCSSGVASFTNIVIQKAGTYKLQAASGAFSSVVSSGFNVISAAPVSLAFSTQPQTAQSDQPIPAFATTAYDTYGNVATGFTGNVTVAINSGTGTLSGTTTVPSVAGVAEFTNARIALPGSDPDTFTLKANGGGLPQVVSTEFVVDPEAAHFMRFHVQPSDTTAGVAIPSFQVWFYDADGELCTDDNYDVTISIASGSGPIYSGTTTKNVLGTGKAIFDDIVIRKADTYTFSATCPAALTELSGSFVVSPAATASLAFTTQPVSSIAGTVMPTVVVTAHDDFGNVATGFSGVVTMSKASGLGTLSGTLTATALNGVARFTNLSINEDGLHTLRATTDGLTIVSNSFDVTPVATEVDFLTQPGNTTAGSTIPDFTVGIYDHDGDLVTDYVGDVLVEVASGSGGIVSGNTTVHVVDGVATFTGLVIDVAGAYTLRATSDALTAAVSASFTVAPSTATGLTFSTQPSNAAAGSPIGAFAVTVHDAFGNTVTGYVGSLIVSIASGPGGFVSGSTTVSVVGGVATFSGLVIQKAGVYTLLASDGGLTTTVSNSFTISPLAASTIGFSVQPRNTTDTVPIPAFAVTAYDVYGNVATTFTGAVTVAVNTGSGTITGTTTVNAVSGVATFTGLRIATPDTYTLRATSGSFAPAISQSFVVSTSLPAGLRLLTTIPGRLPVSGIVPPVTVQVVDELGFAVKVAGIAVNVTLAGGDVCGLFGTLSGVTDANGQVVFTNLGIQRTGSLQLQFLSPGLASVLSNLFEVIPSVIPNQRRWR